MKTNLPMRSKKIRKKIKKTLSYDDAKLNIERRSKETFMCDFADMICFSA